MDDASARLDDDEQRSAGNPDVTLGGCHEEAFAAALPQATCTMPWPMGSTGLQRGSVHLSHDQRDFVFGKPAN